MTARDELRRAVITLAEQAGAEIASLYQRGGVQLEDKADGTPLTEADLASERILTEGLRRWSADPIASEETAAAPHAERRGWTRFWLVDPLDGTREFVNRTGEFAVSVALVDGGRPVLGVIHAPMLGVTWSALTGVGAFRRTTVGGDDTPLPPRASPAVPTALVSRSHRSGGRTDAFLEAVGVREMIPAGSAMKFGFMAEGRADVYVRLGPTMEWDVAAGECICREQGLEVVRVPTGEPLDYNTETLVNPSFIVRDPKDPRFAALPEPPRASS